MHTVTDTQSSTITFRELPYLASGQWKPDRSSDYTKDCRAGREAGAKLREAIQRSGNPTLLGAVVSSIVAAGDWGGVEIGLFSELGIALT